MCPNTCNKDRETSPQVSISKGERKNEKLDLRGFRWHTPMTPALGSASRKITTSTDSFIARWHWCGFEGCRSDHHLYGLPLNLHFLPMSPNPAREWTAGLRASDILLNPRPPCHARASRDGLSGVFEQVKRKPLASFALGLVPNLQGLMSQMTVSLSEHIMFQDISWNYLWFQKLLFICL